MLQFWSKATYSFYRPLKEGLLLWNYETHWRNPQSLSRTACRWTLPWARSIQSAHISLIYIFRFSGQNLIYIFCTRAFPSIHDFTILIIWGLFKWNHSRTVPGEEVMAVKNNLYGHWWDTPVIKQQMDPICTDLLGTLPGPLHHHTLDVFGKTYKHASTEQPSHIWQRVKLTKCLIMQFS
jgi:hypothetical protein